MLFEDIRTLHECAEADHAVGDQIADGVWIERRTILRLGAASLAALLTGFPIASADEPSKPDASPDAIDLDAFVLQAQPLARKLVAAEVPDEERYLKTIARLIARIEGIKPSTLRPRQKYGMRTEVLFRPLIIYQMRLAPGARIPLHDHRNYNGVLMGLEGSASCRNFEVVDEGQPTEGEVTIRVSSETEVERGVISTLSRRRDNLHELQAGTRGARLLDVFTHFADDARSHWIKREPRPLDPEARTYKATWRKRK